MSERCHHCGQPIHYGGITLGWVHDEGEGTSARHATFPERGDEPQ